MSETAAEQVVLAAIEAAKTAEETWHNCACAEGQRCEHIVASLAADAALEAAREALRAQPRTWDLCEEGHWYSTVTATSCEEALTLAREGVDRANYDVQHTIWIDVRVRCVLSDESDSDTVALDPDAPPCADSSGHDWESPIELVGGCRENPGVHGHGGGVVITEVCMHCGCERVTDTWAQNPSNGVQGLDSVRYEPRKHADQIGKMRWTSARKRLEAALGEYDAEIDDRQQYARVRGDVSTEVREQIEQALGEGWATSLAGGGDLIVEMGGAS
jgi:hypothetical protein